MELKIKLLLIQAMAEFASEQRTRKNGEDLSDINLKYTKKFETMFRQELLSYRREIEKESDKSIAWCACGDALETQPIKNIAGLIVDYQYYCMGCDDTYELKIKTNQDETNKI